MKGGAVGKQIQPFSSGAAAVEEIARRIASAPGLEGLSPKQLQSVAGAVLGRRMMEALDRAAIVAGLDIDAEREAFLASYGQNSARAYRQALGRLWAWAEGRKLPVAGMVFKDADDFAYYLNRETSGLSANSIRLALAGCSAFFAFLERRHDRIRNPFKGSKAAPKKAPSPRREFAIPSPEDVETIREALPRGALRAAVVLMAARGLRIGALPGLLVHGERFQSISKGKAIKGILPPEALEELRRSGLSMRKPFEGLTAQKLADDARYQISKLSEAGKIGGRYSVHDFRHFFAVQEYERTKDIFRLKTMLDHVGIGITEAYLKGLGILAV
jgi:site-specific recombinase XerD